MPGTGGVFLTNFMNAARINLHADFAFSENYGHAHHTDLWKKFWIGDHFVEEDSQSLIDRILNLANVFNVKIPLPYFSAAHISDIKLVQAHFEKNIRIVYEQSDLSEIALCYIGKYEIEISNTLITEFTYDEIFKRVERFLELFTRTEDNNTCCISWKDLTKNDPNILIEKLHNLTNIPKNNFQIENLLEWRTQTFNGIEKIKESLATKYNTGD